MALSGLQSLVNHCRRSVGESITPRRNQIAVLSFPKHRREVFYGEEPFTEASSYMGDDYFERGVALCEKLMNIITMKYVNGEFTQHDVVRYGRRVMDLAYELDTQPGKDIVDVIRDFISDLQNAS